LQRQLAALQRASLRLDTRVRRSRVAMRVLLTAALVLGIYAEVFAIVAVGREEARADTPWVVLVAIGLNLGVAAWPMLRAVWWPLDESDLGPPPADEDA
jgi:hypothetical protein